MVKLFQNVSGNAAFLKKAAPKNFHVFLIKELFKNNPLWFRYKHGGIAMGHPAIFLRPDQIS